MLLLRLLSGGSGGSSWLRYAGFSSRWVLWLQSTGSRPCGLRCLQYLGSVAAERRLRSRGARALLPRGMWDLPRPMTELMSATLAGRFSTTGPPGKAYMCLYIKVKLNRCAANLKLTAYYKSATLQLLKNSSLKTHLPLLVSYSCMTNNHKNLNFSCKNKCLFDSQEVWVG